LEAKLSNKKDTALPAILAEATRDLVDQHVAAGVQAIGKVLTDAIEKLGASQNDVAAFMADAIAKLAAAVTELKEEDAKTRRMIVEIADFLTDKTIEGDKRLGDRIASVERRVPSSGR
jgi:hypothetical protein